MGKADYIPALPVGHIKAWSNLVYDNVRLNFWNDDSIVKHDSIIFSAYGTPKLDLHVRDGFKVYVDSGGFQAIIKNDDPDPITVLRYQEKYGDVGMVLDKPPVIYNASHGNTKLLSEDEFKKRAMYTASNAQIALDNRISTKLKLLNILQGSEWKDLELWWSYVKNIKLDGWAIAPKPPSDVFNVARTLSFIFEKEDDLKLLHVLGTSGRSVVPVIAYAAKLYDKNITFDSATPFIEGGAYFIYNLPCSLGKLFYGQKRVYYKSASISSFPCECEVCSVLKRNGITFTDLGVNNSELTPGVTQILVCLHNLVMMKEFFTMLNSLVLDEEIFFSVLDKLYEKSSVKDIKKAIQLLSNIHRDGLESIKRCKNVSLFNF